MENIENKKEESVEKKEKSGLSLGSAIVVGALLISGAILFSNFSDVGSGGDLNTKTQNDLPIADVTEEDFIKGDINAEVLLVEYSDFSCGFCARYHPTMKRIVEEYKGKVAWVYRHLPIFNKSAAVASTCVGNILGDESFFLYADKIFENQKDVNSDFLKKEAISLGVKEGDYDKCINDKNINDQISRDFSLARNLAGFNSTPTTVLITKDGKKYPFTGALSFEEVSAQIDFILEN